MPLVFFLGSRGPLCFGRLKVIEVHDHAGRSDVLFGVLLRLENRLLEAKPGSFELVIKGVEIIRLVLLRLSRHLWSPDPWGRELSRAAVAPVLGRRVTAASLWSASTF